MSGYVLFCQEREREPVCNNSIHEGGKAVKSKRMALKGLVLTALIGAFILPLNPISQAHELSLTGQYRWYLTNMSNGVKYANVTCNYDLLTINGQVIIGSQVDTARSYWNVYSANKAKFDYAVSGVAKCDFITTTQPAWNNLENVEGNVLAITLLRNSSGQMNIAGSTYGVGGFNSGTAVYAAIWFNPGNVAIYSPGYPKAYLYTNDYVFRQNYLIRHEMGHVLGLGHPPDTTVSLMHAHDDSPWNIPQDHDRNDLIAFYP